MTNLVSNCEVYFVLKEQVGPGLRYPILTRQPATSLKFLLLKFVHKKGGSTDMHAANTFLYCKYGTVITMATPTDEKYD